MISKRIVGAVLIGLSLLFCTGCATEEETMEEKFSAFRDKIGYDHWNNAVSPEKELLLENESKTLTYRVSYHPDITSEEAARQFEAQEEHAAKEQTTWEQTMWEYNRFCYENNFPWSDDQVCFDPMFWDQELWKYVTEDVQKKSTTETMFFSRADGCYSIEMTYPDEDIVSRMGMYVLALRQEFQVDLDRIEKIRNGLDTKEEVNGKGEFVVTVTNSGNEETLVVYCSINGPNIPENPTYQEIIAFGETATFTFSPESTKDITEYRTDIGAYFVKRMIDLDGKTWMMS